VASRRRRPLLRQAGNLPPVLTYAGFDPDSDGFVTISEFAKVLKEIIPLKLALAIFKALPEDP
jgi:hypothetical protein